MCVVWLECKNSVYKFHKKNKEQVVVVLGYDSGWNDTSIHQLAASTLDFTANLPALNMMPLLQRCVTARLYSLSFSNTRPCCCSCGIAPMHCFPHHKKRKARLFSSSSFWTWRPVLQRNPQPVYNELTEKKSSHLKQGVANMWPCTHTHTKQKKGSCFEPAGQTNLPQTPKGLGDKPAQFPGTPKACSQTISQGRCQKFQQFSGGTLWSATVSRKSQTWAAVFATCL